MNPTQFSYVILSAEQYTALTNHDDYLKARSEIKNRLWRVVKAHQTDIQLWPGGREFMLELSNALERA